MQPWEGSPPSGPWICERMMYKLQNSDFILGFWAVVLLKLGSIYVCEHTWFLMFWVFLCLYLISVFWFRCLMWMACYKHSYLPTGRTFRTTVSSYTGRVLNSTAPFAWLLWTCTAWWLWSSYYRCQHWSWVSQLVICHIPCWPQIYSAL